MKKLILPLCLLGVCILTSVVCMFASTRKQATVPSDKLVTREISVGAFHEISAEIADVKVTVGPATGKATLTAADNIIDDVVVKVSGGELKVSLKKDSNIKHSKKLDITLTVTAPYIDEVDASLSSCVTFSGDMIVPGDASYEAETSASVILKGVTVGGKCEMDVDTSGSISVRSLTSSQKACFDADTSGSIEIDSVSAPDVKAKADTSGSVILKVGKAANAEYSADTTGAVDASGLEVETATASADTAGRVKCKVKNLTSRQDTGGSVKNVLK